jgi:RNA polymerase sigma-70 factor (ECF subfamily)
VDLRRHEHRHRRNVSRDRNYPDETSVQMVLRIVARTTSPSQAAMRAELQQQVRELLECLTDDDRELLMMRHVDGLTLKQAARVLEISHDAALQRHRRALERLKRRWRSQFGEEDRPE